MVAVDKAVRVYNNPKYAEDKCLLLFTNPTSVLRMAPDAALASVISTILVVAGHQSITSGIAIAVPIAAAGQVLTILCRTLTVVFQHKADSYALEGSTRGVDICHMGALIIQALRVAVPSTLVAMNNAEEKVTQRLIKPLDAYSDTDRYLQICSKRRQEVLDKTDTAHMSPEIAAKFEADLQQRVVEQTLMEELERISAAETEKLIDEIAQDMNAILN